MTLPDKLHNYLETAARVNGDKIYIKTSSACFSFSRVFEMAVFLQEIFKHNGIQEYDRVVLYSSKNAASIAVMAACSKCEALYIPVAAANPAERAKFIIYETNPRFIVCDEMTSAELKNLSLPIELIHATEDVCIFKFFPVERDVFANHQSGFILYTSGSTGTPKGVLISHEAAIAFIDWAANEFNILESDVLASIAPFNFDLSVFDIYVTAKKSATLILYSEEDTKNALLMAQKLSDDNVSTIYATPTFFTTLANYGKLHKYNYSSLRNVLFAGEIFQPDNFNKLIENWPGKRYANLYGPTETNVCTFYRIHNTHPGNAMFPIGKPCAYAKCKLVDSDENEIMEKNVEGELWVSAESLFTGYWKDADKTNASMRVSNDKNIYYRTGDIVFKNNDDDFVFVSRKDRMIKKNGFRIEPSEVEKVITSFPHVVHVAVLFSKTKNQLVCFMEIAQDFKYDTMQLKLFCQKFLPLYMVPDKFVFLDAMPKNTSGKVDLQLLDKQLQ